MGTSHISAQRSPSLRTWLVAALLLTLALAGCAPPTPAPTPTASPTPSPTLPPPSATALPRYTATLPPPPTLTPIPSPTFTPTPWPLLPAGAPLPPDLPVISYANAGQVVRLAAWQEDAVADLAWSGGGELLGIAAADSIRLYNPDTRELVQRLDSGPGVTSLAFSPRFNFLAAGFRLGSEAEGYAGRIDFWRVSGWEKLGSLYGDNRAVNQVAFAPGGRAFAASFITPVFEEDSVIIWETTDWTITRTLRTDDALAIAFSPDSQLLATSPDRYSVKIWRLEDARRISVLRTAFSDAVSAMAFSPSGEILATGHYEGQIRLWEVAKGTLLRVMESGGVVTSLAFNRDGTVLAAGDGGKDYAVRLWDAETGLLLQVLKDHPHAVDSLVFAPSGRVLASGSYDGRVRLWAVR